ARVLRDKPTMVAARTRKPATDHPVVAEAEKPKRGFLAKLFGFGEEGDDEDAHEAAPSKAPVAVAHHSEPPKPAQVAAATAVPMPAARPARATRSGDFNLASASSTPAKLTPAAAQPSATDVINSRVDWRGQVTQEPETETVAQAAPAPGAIGAGGARFQWIVGPPGRPVAEGPPRPPAEIASATPPQEATGGLGDWPNNIRQDRGKGEMTLAYAAVAPTSETRTRSLGAIRPAAAEPARAAKPVAAAAPPPGSAWSAMQKSAPRIQDPWLRAIVMAPSAYYSMRVALLGPADFRSLTTLMRKPPSAIAMVFTVDPYNGLTSEGFAGSAVSFVPTITFGTRTAALN
ncbi:MAG: hypothetical protein JO326_00860, partial [Acetobacteraceae bacterium]|nr:hypothetical protein [Acetobacteraceae bacterium]